MNIDQLDQAKSDELRRWWSDWAEADFTWEGIGKRHSRDTPQYKWEGYYSHGGKVYRRDDKPDGALPCTLQDYWRFDPDRNLLRSDEEMSESGLLTGFQGQLYHLIHVPFGGPFGTTTFKDKSPLEMTGRLQAEIMAKLKVSNADRVGTRKSSSGATEIVGVDGRVQLQGAILCADWLPKNELHLAAKSAFIKDRLALQGVHICAGSQFSNCVFDGPFIWLGESDGKVEFSSSVFCDRVFMFLTDSQCELSVESCRVHGTFDIQNSRVASIATTSSKFYGKFYAARVQLDGNFNAYWSEFFQDCCWDRSKIGGDLDGSYSKFHDSVWVDGVDVAGSAEFSRSVFHGAFSFGDDAFHKHDLKRATVGGALKFDDAEFRDTCSFKDLELCPDIHSFEGAFRGTIFGKRLSWTNSGLHAVAAFGEARLEHGVDYPSLAEASEEKVFADKALLPAIESGDQSLLALEAGARTLQKSAELHGDILRQHRFHKLAIMSRQNQLRAPFAEKLIAKAYGWTSGYGLSPLRAGRSLLTLFVVSVCFFLLSIGIAAPAAWEGVSLSLGAPVHPTVASVLEFVSGNMFGPIAISTFDAEPFSHLGVDDSFRLRAWLGAWGVLQQVIAVAFWFQLILTIRRRFQIT